MTIKLLFPAENSTLLVSLAWTAVECWPVNLLSADSV